MELKKIMKMYLDHLNSNIMSTWFDHNIPGTFKVPNDTRDKSVQIINANTNSSYGEAPIFIGPCPKLIALAPIK